MNFDELIQLQVLKLKALTSGRLPGAIADAIVDSGQIPEVRQMCAKVSPQLYARLENVTGALSMSKREFIEAAVAEAVEKAENAIEQAGVAPWEDA